MFPFSCHLFISGLAAAAAGPNLQSRFTLRARTVVLMRTNVHGSLCACARCRARAHLVPVCCAAAVWQSAERSSFPRSTSS